MEIKDVMSRRPAFVGPDTPLWLATRKMKDRGCGFLPVVERGVPIGVVTSRRLAEALALDQRCPYATMVSEIMSAAPISLNLHADIKEAAQLMSECHVGLLLVTDEKRVLRGVLSARGVAEQLNQASRTAYAL